MTAINAMHTHIVPALVTKIKSKSKTVVDPGADCVRTTAFFYKTALFNVPVI